MSHTKAFSTTGEQRFQTEYSRERSKSKAREVAEVPPRHRHSRHLLPVQEIAPHLQRHLRPRRLQEQILHDIHPVRHSHTPRSVRPVVTSTATEPRGTSFGGNIKQTATNS